MAQIGDDTLSLTCNDAPTACVIAGPTNYCFGSLSSKSKNGCGWSCVQETRQDKTTQNIHVEPHQLLKAVFTSKVSGALHSGGLLTAVLLVILPLWAVPEAPVLYMS